MTTGQIEKRFPRYALAYIWLLAGERDTIPTPTPPPIYDGITPAEIPAPARRAARAVSAMTNIRAHGLASAADEVTQPPAGDRLAAHRRPISAAPPAGR
jgi:hypothetical protein